MAITDILLRYTAYPPLTTKGSELTFTEGDANLIEIYEYLQSLASASGVAPYNAGTTYTGTQYVTYGGNLWQHVTSSSTGVTPGTNPAVWSLTSIGAISHVQNTDTALATGTANQVTAAELKALLNDGFKTATRAAAITLRNTNALKPGYFYYLSDKRIALQATSVGALSTSGFYLAYDADYANASGQMLVASGSDAVWADSSSYWWSSIVTDYPLVANRIGKYCIYKGTHYRSLTGLNDPSDTPDIDAVNWVVATPGHASYRRAVDGVIYDLDNDLIMMRSDKRGNVVKRPYYITEPLEARFQFGRDEVRNNVIEGNIDMKYNRGTVANNYVSPSSYLEINNNGADGLLSGAEVSYNNLQGSNVSVNDNEGYISLNNFESTVLNVYGNTLSASISSNKFERVTNCTFTLNESPFTSNEYRNLSTLELGLTGYGASFWTYCTWDGSFDLDGTSGSTGLTAKNNKSEFLTSVTIEDFDTILDLLFRDTTDVTINGSSTATVDTISCKQYGKIVKIAPVSGATLTLDCGPSNIISLDGSTTTYTLLGANGDYALGVLSTSDQFDIIKIVNF